ncbi:MAG: aromatic amino acid aminotransferase [Betaproteobacteria bacterium RIFCSPLOWO2_02_FULL_63_19]|nr:MAG: aromatic amino acid aminotransferase [Betaproteobacteria bacterium RIFCSPLOWO2_02_FULL_63_19]
MTSNVLSHVEMAPRDPILGVTEAFVADKNPNKVNLGVGIYYDDTGKVPVLECVRRVERDMAEKSAPRAYLPIDGLAAYDKAIQTLVFGGDSPALKDNRVVTVQTLGGTGGLKVGADFLRRTLPQAQVWISDPSWENHRAIFENAGFVVNNYPYYDAPTHGVNFNGMIDCLRGLPKGSIVVLHACCHNPTGVDLSADQWAAVAETVNKQGLVPLLDIAYQGFGDGLDADAAAVRIFDKAGGAAFVANSFSKTFSLYGERVGGLSVVAGNKDEAARVLSQIKRLVRSNYSNPPTHGGQIVASVLTSPEARAQWEQELGQMRARIRTVRQQLVDKLRAKAPKHDFEFVTRQRGMFSYSGLSKQAVTRLREEFSVYAIDTGRICVAAINSKNIDYVSDSIAKVVG